MTPDDVVGEPVQLRPAPTPIPTITLTTGRHHATRRVIDYTAEFGSHADGTVLDDHGLKDDDE